MNKSIARYCQFHIYFLFGLFANGLFRLIHSAKKDIWPVKGKEWKIHTILSDGLIFAVFGNGKCFIYFLLTIFNLNMRVSAFFSSSTLPLRWKGVANGRPFPVCQNRKRFTQFFFQVHNWNERKPVNKQMKIPWLLWRWCFLFDGRYVCVCIWFFFCVILTGTLHC